MEFKLQDFLDAPSVEAIHSYTKENMFAIAEYYGLEVSRQAKKQVLVRDICAQLVARGIIPAPKVIAEPVPHSVGESVRLKELEVELQRLSIRKKELQLANELEMRKLELRMREMELGAADRATEFDVAKYIHLVPPFNEGDVDKYFVLFERVATTLKWPRNMWTLLLQSVLDGKAQQVYSSLSPDDCGDYNRVKLAVLRAYELVPEAYRQRFRRLRKRHDHTFTEFVREKETLFDRWCLSSGVTDFGELKHLVLMEDFKNCLPEAVSTFLNEHKTSDVFKAAILVEEYTLTHKPVFLDRPFSKVGGGRASRVVSEGREASIGGFESERRPAFSDTSEQKDKGELFGKGEIKCFYCKKKGHIVAECPMLEQKGRRKAKLVNLVNSRRDNVGASAGAVELADFAPFVMDGYVSLPGHGSEVPVKILRDTAASQSFILAGVLPLGPGSAVGSDVPVLGFGMEDLNVPLHRVCIRSDLLSGEVTVGVRPAFPVQGVAFLVTPEVTPVPITQSPDELARKFPTVFAACAVTRSKYRKGEDEIGLSDSFRCGGVDMPQPTSGTEVEVAPNLERLTLSRQQLAECQRVDASLTPLFERVVATGAVDTLTTGFFLKDGILMRKFTPPCVSPAEDWCVSTQIVVPRPYRSEILSLAHETPLSGHLGIRKTHDRILRNFFWPGLKGDVAQFCKTCHMCQIAGKPNQVIPPAPLYPILVIGEPFERVLVDCVGPLPRTKSGTKFLLTVMCASTRFPEVFPLRKITAPVVVKARTKFFSLFGLPRVVQTDQGTNFTSRLFSQVLQQLHIKHVCSSAYHPESQGALERFHQTLKSMLRTFCLEFQRDWDEGVHLQMFAIREVVQESLGFSPAELVFGHHVRGPLRLLREEWLDKGTEKNLLDYVCDFRERLRRVREIAREHLQTAQKRMKSWCSW
uniref:Gypsy retrotransposon integrase-like protein 1 n=1 Tax=Takifugu rubripes TaxID=31033 RepID=A0A674NL88_TAKRU